MKNVVIYTRGVAPDLPAKGGWAALLLFDDHVKELSGPLKEATQNRSELSAIAEALDALTEPCKVTILSTSQHAVNALRKGWVAMWWHNSWHSLQQQEVKNSDLWKQIFELCRIHEITWTNIPSEPGIKWSIKAKQLADEAMIMFFSRREHGYKR